MNHTDHDDIERTICLPSVRWGWDVDIIFKPHILSIINQQFTELHGQGHMSGYENSSLNYQFAF